jgi:hypothetical protein
MSGLEQYTLLGNVVGLCWALCITLHWVMLVYVGHWATQYTLMGNVVGLGNTPYWEMLLGLGQHTLLGNVVDLCWPTGNTLHWVLLVNVRFRKTHFPVHHC